MNSLTTETLEAAIRAGFGNAASVRARRPGRLFQIEVPAFLADGDGVQLYVEPTKGDELRVSDVGQTLMRISYTRELDDAVTEKISGLAERNGFSLAEGVLAAFVKPRELVAALFGLAQVQAVAEATAQAVVSRGPRAEDFRALVISVLREQFGEQLETDVLPPGDADKSYAIDAVVHTSRPVAVIAVANEGLADRAIANRFHARDMPVREWIAVPRNMDSLSRTARNRLTNAFVIAHSAFDPVAVQARVLNLAS